MYHYSKVLWSCWCKSLLIVIPLMLSVLTMQAGPAFAAACNPATPLDASTTAQTCSVGISATVISGVLTMATDANAVLTGPAGNTTSPFTLKGTAIPVTFTFTSLIKDHRGVNTGWVLTATSAGLTGVSGLAAGTTLPLNITSSVPTCTNGTCAPVTFTAASPLTATPIRILTTSAASGVSQVIVDGDYSNLISGSFTIPAGSPSGTYSGAITVTLTNTF